MSLLEYLLWSEQYQRSYFAGPHFQVTNTTCYSFLVTTCTTCLVSHQFYSHSDGSFCSLIVRCTSESKTSECKQCFPCFCSFTLHFKGKQLMYQCRQVFMTILKKMSQKIFSEDMNKINVLRNVLEYCGIHSLITGCVWVCL